MSRRIKPKGRKLKNLSDPSLAKPHKKGSKLYFTLNSLDPIWGRYLYHLYHRHGLILRQCLRSYKRTIVLLNQCRSLKVDKNTGFRMIPDYLRNKLEIESMMLLILLKLGLEYLVVEYQPIIRSIKEYLGEEYPEPSDKEDLNNKLKILKDTIGIKAEIPIQIYTILERRHIVEHPTTERLQEGSDTGWKAVNLSWVLSGEVEGIVDPIVHFVNEFIKTIEAYIKANPVPGALTGLTRGAKAGEQYKKPVN